MTDFSNQLIAPPLVERTGAYIIAVERHRQVAVEGHGAINDDAYTAGELPTAAVAYALPNDTDAIEFWPVQMSPEIFKRHKHDRIKQLAIAGALIAAEIDRLMRIEDLKQVKAAG